MGHFKPLGPFSDYAQEPVKLIDDQGVVHWAKPVDRRLRRKDREDLYQLLALLDSPWLLELSFSGIPAALRNFSAAA